MYAARAASSISSRVARGPPVTEVGQDGVVEEVALLGHEADGGGQRGLADAAHVDPVDLDRPAGDVVEARDQVADRGLARAARPDQRDEMARFGSEADALEGVSFDSGVAEIDVRERHPAADRGHRKIDGVGRVDDVGHHVEVLEDPVEQGQRRAQLHRDLQQLPDREVQPGLERGEGHDGAGRDGGAVRQQQAGDEVDRRRGDRQERLHHGVEALADHLLAELEVGQALVLLPVAGDVAQLAAEHLGQQHPGHRQGFLADGAHGRQRLLGRASTPGGAVRRPFWSARRTPAR